MRNVTTCLRPKRFVRIAAAVATAVLGLAAPCLACYSGLVVIPTADMVEPGGYAIEPQFDGLLAGSSIDTRILNLQSGISPRLEAGVDFDMSYDADPRILGNCKYLMAPGSKRAPAIALGLCNAGSKIRSSPYLVATQESGSLRGHFGIMRIEGNNRWFAGVDRAVSDRLTLVADYTSGDDNFASVGFNYQFEDEFGVMAGVLFPNAGDEDTGFSLHLVFTGSWLSSAKDK
ncbi:MAG TPA: hypothetical protein VMX94_02925 [Armatimonadota bacterium]|nr:hypothetical protein [Armatimonadota bacterium]